MSKKYIFIDLDGTILAHNGVGASASTVDALQQLQQNGHEVFIATGRPPCMFYGIEKKLNIDSYIAANGRIAVHKGEVIFKSPIDRSLTQGFTESMAELGFDVGYEAFDDYYVNSRNTDFVDKFNEMFNLDYPEVKENKYLTDDVYQMVLYVDGKGCEIAEKHFPHVHYTISNPYGVDITDSPGLKDIGVKAMVEYLGISPEDCIAVGDGYNDISMLNYVGCGIAMGNAYEEVKNHADMVTDTIENNGLYKAFKKLNLI